MKYFYPLIVVAFCIAGCGDDSTTTESASSEGLATDSAVMPVDTSVSVNTPAEQQAGADDAAVADQTNGASGLESTGAIAPDANAGLDAADPTACAADGPGEICVLVQVPADIPSMPEKVSIHFFNALPPVGPPNLMGAEIAEASELAQFVPGATIPMVLSGIPSQGGMFLYGVLYMPGGGAQTWQTIPGVDFHGAYDWYEAVPFTGQPTNLPKPLSFTLYEE